jgi:hypothetical protein
MFNSINLAEAKNWEPNHTQHEHQYFWVDTPGKTMEGK